MKTEKQKWKKSEIIKKYFNYIIKTVFNQSSLSEEDKLDKIYIKDMLFYEILKLPEIAPKQSYIDNLEYDKEFINQNVTQYQKDNITCFIKNSLDAKFKLTPISSYKIERNILTIAESFFNEINPNLKDELVSATKEKRLFMCNNILHKHCVGTTYCFDEENYYKIDLNTLSNPLFTLCHEIIHGYISLITERKFDTNKKIILYREVASLLIEFYLNDYALNNNLISKEEYISNFNDFFCGAGYEDIEIIDVLYSICSNKNFEIDEKNIVNFIKNKKQERLDYDFDLDELTEAPLRHHLIYLYSFMIATGIYYKFKNDNSKGMNTAFEIIKRINYDNEEEILNSYGINPVDSFKKYIDDNNELIKKMNN